MRRRNCRFLVAIGRIAFDCKKVVEVLVDFQGRPAETQQEKAHWAFLWRTAPAPVRMPSRDGIASWWQPAFLKPTHEDTSMRQMLLLIVVIFAITAVVSGQTTQAKKAERTEPAEEPATAAARAEGLKADLAKLRGKWVLKDKNERTRATKEVGDNNQETVTYFDDEGKVVNAFTVEFKLDRLGNIRVFTFSKMKVVDGPNKGKEYPGAYTYIYTTDGQTFAEAQGILIGQEGTLAQGGPKLNVWKRAKE
jgi:hypothetical protein